MTIDVDYDRKKVHDWIKYVASVREDLHKGQKLNRHLSEDHEYIGLLGEWDFAQRYGLPMDFCLRKKGDRGRDFVTKIGIIDVKTSRKPNNLFMEVGKKNLNDIFVLMGYDESDDSTYFVGWEYKEEMYKCPKAVFHSYGILNYYKPANQLRDMLDLEIELFENA